MALEYTHKSHSGHPFDPNKPRVRTSGFWVTINTNQCHSGYVATSYAKELGDVIEDVFSEDNLPNFTKFVEGAEEGWAVPVEARPPFIESVDVQDVVERGSRTGQMHAHVLVTIKHRTKLQLDKQFIEESVKSQLNLSSVHIDIKLIKGNAALENYMSKTQ